MAVIILKDPFKCPWCLCCHANIPALAAWSWELMLISMETVLLGGHMIGCKGISEKSGGGWQRDPPMSHTHLHKSIGYEYVNLKDLFLLTKDNLIIMTYA